MDPSTKNISDYLNILGRRKYWIIITWLFISVISVVVAYNLPKTFKSTVTMLIETSMPTKLTDLPVTLMAGEEIQTIYQRVLTMGNLLSLIERNGLYGFSKDKPINYDLVDAFKENTEVELATSTLAPGSSGNNTKVAQIVFKLSFNYKDPVKAQQVVADLAGLLIEQNDKARAQRATKVTDFLLVELEKLELKSQDIDVKIAKYKGQHNLSLPEQAQGNIATLERTETDLKDIENQIRSTKDKVAVLEEGIARAKAEIPSALTTADTPPKNKEEALKMLRAQYIQLSSIYSPSHPSLIRLKRELNALDSSYEFDANEDDTVKQLADSKRELVVLEKTYAGNHPELVKRRKQIELLEKQLRKTKFNQEPGFSVHPSSSANFSLEMQYRSSQSELNTLFEKQSYLKAKLEKIQNILSTSPQVELEYTDLVRERDSTLKKYNQLKEKWLDAKLVQAMEEEQKGETLTIIDPPIVPIHPEKAIRRKVAIGGFFVGIFAGIGLAFLVEFLDPGIRGYRSLAAVTGLMPLIVVPYIESPEEEKNKLARQRRVKKMLAWFVTLSFILTVAVIIYVLKDAV